MYHQNIMSYPQTKAGRPRNQALDPAILENLLGNLRAIPALAILGSLLAEEERHPAGIPDDWPDRVLSVIWPHDTSPASPRPDRNPLASNLYLPPSAVPLVRQ